MARLPRVIVPEDEVGFTAAVVSVGVVVSTTHGVWLEAGTMFPMVMTPVESCVF
jgi:hypothetical protein